MFGVRCWEGEEKVGSFFCGGVAVDLRGLTTPGKIAIFLLGLCPLVNDFIGNAPVAPGLER